MMMSSSFGGVLQECVKRKFTVKTEHSPLQSTLLCRALSFARRLPDLGLVEGCCDARQFCLNLPYVGPGWFFYFPEANSRVAAIHMLTGTLWAHENTHTTTPTQQPKPPSHHTSASAIHSWTAARCEQRKTTKRDRDDPNFPPGQKRTKTPKTLRVVPQNPDDNATCGADGLWLSEAQRAFTLATTAGFQVLGHHCIGAWSAGTTQPLPDQTLIKQGGPSFSQALVSMPVGADVILVRPDLAHLFSIKKPRVLPTLLATF